MTNSKVVTIADDGAVSVKHATLADVLLPKEEDISPEERKLLEEARAERADLVLALGQLARGRKFKSFAL